ncbi:hypothetical protein [Micromonospora sp. WMMD812]|uniref:hypothetical protein n=1 Tax=Micromonospora sp. WMMD812 TaxID=3015152 RepID=UPI00248C607B|nr:hypothetical protein [Micromonospora sp. WMMD812]WBB68609.1 hypothetical protein O7603_04305 [Micromonospora sp. WMMD812]
MTVIFPVRTRLRAEQLVAYDLSAPPTTTTALTPAAVFPVDPEVGRVDNRAAARDLTRAVYATAGTAVCVDRDGRQLWRLDFGPRREDSYVGHVSCAFSLDGQVVWIYRPDAMAGRGAGLDRWLAVDAATGAVLAEVELPTIGRAASTSRIRTAGTS